MNTLALSHTFNSDFWSPDGAQASLLLVDDDEVALTLMATILGDAGFAVEMASSAADAQAWLERKRFDVVVLDLMLADVDGREMCREIRARFGRSVGVLMVSARGRLAVAMTLEAGADDFLAKPFEVDELEARVRALLRSRALEAAALRRAERLVSLQRISAAVARRLREPEMVELVLQDSRRLLDAATVIMYTWDASDRLLRPVHSVGAETRAPLTALRPGEGIVGRAFGERQPCLVADYAAWDGASEGGRQAGVRAAVAAPILYEDEPIGVIVGLTAAAHSAFDDEDAQLLGLLASHTAVAFYNARLYAAQREVAARAARRAAELEAVLETMTDGVLLVDAQGTVTSANCAAAAILGGEPIATGTVTLDRLLVGFQPARDPDKDAAEEDEPSAEETPTTADLIRFGGGELEGEVGEQVRRLGVSSSPIGDGEAGTLVVLRDVTDQRLLEQRHAQAERLRTLGQLATGVAHGVNNLLAAVLGRAELARIEVERGDIQPDHLADALRLIEQAAEDGAQMVRRIQELAQPGTDEDVSIVDLAGVIRDVLELTRPRWQESVSAGGRPIRVSADLQDGLWVEAAPAELREVLTNLVLNAIDAMATGGELTIRGRRLGDKVRVAVSDTGVGMPPSVVRRVFEPFFTTKAEGGTGLGLPISHGIVRRRGGDMIVQSEVDHGTTVTVELPRALAAEIASPVAGQLSDHRPVPTGGSIMVVDDDPSLAQLLRRVLEAHNYRVTTCTSAFEALNLFDPREYSIVISDYAMPGANGLELAAALHARSPATPILLMTAWGSGLDLGHVPPEIAGVVTKPYRLAEVIEAVDAALARNDRQ